jgi:hypothetical protein
MNRYEAFAAMCDGKKVRDKRWLKNQYCFMTEKGCIVDNTRGAHFMFPRGTEWELYQEETEDLDKLTREITLLKKTLARTHQELAEERQRNAKLIMTNMELLETKANPMFVYKGANGYCYQCCCNK